MLIAKGLKKNYTSKVKTGFLKSTTKKVEAVRGLDLTIEPGSIVGLLGLNGAGKTTTIKMLSTLLEPDEGSCAIDGLDLVKDAFQIKHMVNMIAGGERMVYWRLTARENLEYFGRLYSIPKEELKSRIESLIRFVGLQERSEEAVEKYSKGMKQRLQIARGLINDPKYLFMDEPTLGLDAPIARDLRRFTKSLAKEQGKGILLTSHYISEIEELCDYVYIIDRGLKIMEGTPKEIASIVANCTNKYKIKLNVLPDKLRGQFETFMSTVQSEFQLEEVDGGIEIDVSSHKDIQSELISMLSQQSKIISFTAMEPKLEDAIITLSEVKNYEQVHA
ncbi:MAG: daunorubicin transporter ATP-binding protein [Clostridia bacterium]|jgi:ABC-2 type transport system ATP-binding protein|nr:daunorubicin transporter ATP-binding protein [Clostridia bacterium]